MWHAIWLIISTLCINFRFIQFIKLWSLTTSSILQIIFVIWLQTILRSRLYLETKPNHAHETDHYNKFRHPNSRIHTLMYTHTQTWVIYKHTYIYTHTIVQRLSDNDCSHKDYLNSIKSLIERTPTCNTYIQKMVNVY